MKSKMKRQRQTELPRFIVGALATAGASAASGATVQITFTENYVSNFTGLTKLTEDLTGDGFDEVEGYVGPNSLMIFNVFSGGRTSLATFSTSYANIGGALVGSGASQLAPIQFSDSRINEGALSSGFVEIQAFSFGKTLQINRLIFDDSSVNAPTGLTSASTGIPAWTAVPEPSSLGLLALGAGGLLARRRRAA
jgi:hypothetical protein